MAFFLHDLGYVGKENMDDEEGESHPIWGAEMMGHLFGNKWYYFCLLHSRFFCQRMGKQPSKLCYADKLAVALEPWWCYIPRAIASGEIWEYRQLARCGKYKDLNQSGENHRDWFASVTKYLNKWVEENGP